MRDLLTGLLSFIIIIVIISFIVNTEPKQVNLDKEKHKNGIVIEKDNNVLLGRYFNNTKKRYS